MIKLPKAKDGHIIFINVDPDTGIILNKDGTPNLNGGENCYYI